jgi:hypothetical protein
MIKKSKAFNAFKSLPKKARTVFIMTLVIIVLIIFFVVKSFMVTTVKTPNAQEKGKAEVNAGALIDGKGSAGDVSGGRGRTKDLKTRQENKIKQAKANSGSYIPSMDEEEQIAEISVRTAEDARAEAKEEALEDGLIGEEGPEIDIFGKTRSFETLTLTKKQSVPNSPGMALPRKEYTAKVNQKVKYLSSKIKSWDYTSPGVAASQEISVAIVKSEEQKQSVANASAVNDSDSADDIGKRGYLKGDVIIATLDNYLNSDNAASYARMTIQQGPLRDAKVLATPTVNNDAFNIKSYWLTHKGRSVSFKAVAVTIDDQMKTSMSTDVDYHTFANTSLLVIGSFVQGFAERAENTGTSTTISDTATVINQDETSDRDLIIGGFGEVGKRASAAAIANSTRKPTVILDGKKMGVVGLMMVEDFNPNWLPEIKENQVY